VDLDADVPPVPEQPRFVVGVDLGQSKDYTAIAIREAYKGGRGRTARRDEGWSVQRVAQETGYSVPRVYAIVSRKEQSATEPAEGE
jgi:hypothetical protein